MALNVVVKEVNVENVVKGKTRYSKAVVTYDFKGETRTQNIMSFANPDVFKKVQALEPGQTIAVELTKNAQGYNEWAKVDVASDEPKDAKAAPTGGKVTGSNYETREERAAKQVLIVRQSCLAQAVAYVVGTKEQVESNEELLKLADQFVDWVFQKPDLFDQPNDDLGDVPY